MAALPFRCISRVTFTAGATTTVAVTGSLTQFGAVPAGTFAHGPVQALAPNVTVPSGRPDIFRTVDCATATSNDVVTARKPFAVIWMQVPSLGAAVREIAAVPVVSSTDGPGELPLQPEAAANTSVASTHAAILFMFMLPSRTFERAQGTTGGDRITTATW
jgi:hypothetical protein